jgi:hypothetical protein
MSASNSSQKATNASNGTAEAAASCNFFSASAICDSLSELGLDFSDAVFKNCHDVHLLGVDVEPAQPTLGRPTTYPRCIKAREI